MAEPAQRRTAEDGGKFYEHRTRKTAGGEPVEYDSVTAALGSLEKSGLKWWSAKLAARRAMENLPKMLAAQRVEPCGRTWCRTEPLRCGQCPDCVQRWIELYHVGESNRRRREGSALHDVLEYVIGHGGEWPDLTAVCAAWNQNPDEERVEPADIDPYVTTLRGFMADYGLTAGSFLAAEMTVWHHAHRYAGTLDAIVRVAPVTAKAAKFCARMRPGTPGEPCDVVVDLKSREADDKALYEEHALQLSAYRHAETATLKPLGTEVPMPRTHGGAILQVRPNGYTFEPVRTEIDELRAFLNILEVHRWSQARGPASIAVKSFPVPDGWVWTDDDHNGTRDAVATGPHLPAEVTPAKKTRAPRKTAPRKTAPRKTAVPGKAAAQRVVGATLESLSSTGGMSRAKGNTLRDEDIPF